MKDYVVIITGAGGAIGGATAGTLAAAGADVVVSDINLAAAEQVAKRVSAESGRAAMAIRTDVTDEAQLQELVDTMLRKFGKITALINNVGWGEYTPLWDVSTDYMVKSYFLNTVSAYNLTKLCLPFLQKEENASVTFSGSMVRQGYEYVYAGRVAFHCWRCKELIEMTFKHTQTKENSAIIEEEFTMKKGGEQ